MPRQDRFGKSTFFEAVFVIGILVVTGHLSVNFWEKYFIQSEINEVKNSLYNLKKTVADIGYVYDNLSQEMNGLTTHSLIENDQHITSIGHKYKSKYTVDTNRNPDVTVKSAIATLNPTYYDIKTKDTVDNDQINVTTNTNTKIAEDVSTVAPKEKTTSGAKSRGTSKRRASKAKSTIITDTRPSVDVKTSITANAKPVAEISTLTTNEKPDSDSKSTITTTARLATDVSTITDNRKSVSEASTITPNTKPDVSTVTSKLKAAEDASTITRQPLKSTAAGFCYQHQPCAHEHCKHNNFHCKHNNYHKDNEVYHTLKF